MSTHVGLHEWEQGGGVCQQCVVPQICVADWLFGLRWMPAGIYSLSRGYQSEPCLHSQTSWFQRQEINCSLIWSRGCHAKPAMGYLRMTLTVLYYFILPKPCCSKQIMTRQTRFSQRPWACCGSIEPDKFRAPDNDAVDMICSVVHQHATGPQRAGQQVVMEYL